MFKAPLTYYISSTTHWDPKVRSILMNEFAARGEKHLVFSDGLIMLCMRDFSQVKMLREEMDAAGLTFVDSHAPFGPPNDLNCPFEEIRSRMIAYNVLCMEFAAEFGVKTITIHAGNNHFPGGIEVPVSKHVDYMKDSLDRLLPHAERLGMTICIENIWFTCNTGECLLKVKEAFPTDALGFCYDVGHANLTLKDRGTDENAAVKAWRTVGNTGPVVWQPDLLKDMLPHIVNCHIHDNNGIRDEHLPPGLGNVDWSYVIPMLNNAPRLQCLQSEAFMTSVGDICTRLRDLEKKYT